MKKRSRASALIVCGSRLNNSTLYSYYTPLIIRRTSYPEGFLSADYPWFFLWFTWPMVNSWGFSRIRGLIASCPYGQFHPIFLSRMTSVPCLWSLYQRRHPIRGTTSFQGGFLHNIWEFILSFPMYTMVCFLWGLKGFDELMIWMSGVWAGLV